MEFISVVRNTDKASEKDEGRKHTSSLGISEKRPHVLGIVGGMKHGSDVFLDKANTEKLIQWLEEEVQTMDKYECEDCGPYESNISKCDKCKKV